MIQVRLSTGVIPCSIGSQREHDEAREEEKMEEKFPSLEYTYPSVHVTCRVRGTRTDTHTLSFKRSRTLRPTSCPARSGGCPF